jgi:hypothetical protein
VESGVEEAVDGASSVSGKESKTFRSLQIIEVCQFWNLGWSELGMLEYLNHRTFRIFCIL